MNKNPTSMGTYKLHFEGLVIYNPYFGGPKTFIFPWVLRVQRISVILEKDLQFGKDNCHRHRMC